MEPKAHEVFRIHCHLWTKDNGHADKIFRISGTDLEDALARLHAAATRKYGPRMVINFRSYERV